MLTVLTLLKLNPSPNGEQHGERAWWREHGQRYLDAWLDGVSRYVPEPKQITVMIDDRETAAPHMGGDRLITFCMLDEDVDAPGFWAKLNMFREGVSSGKCLYMDLDNVIRGDLSELCALTPDPLIMLDDRRVPGLPNGSMMLFDAERCRSIWTQYAEHPRESEQYFVPRGEDYSRAYDQAFIAHAAPVNGRIGLQYFQDLLPPSYILNARSELPNAPDWRTARLIFGGGSEKEGKPHTATHPGFALR